jgi:Methyltransferase domain
MKNLFKKIFPTRLPKPTPGMESSSARSLCRQIHRCDIYEGFPHEKYPLDMQGWNSDDPLFRQVMERIRPEFVVELGSWKGASAIHICNLARKMRLEPFTMVCVDTWLGGPWHWQSPDRPDGFPSLGCRHGYPTLYYQFLANVIKSGHQDRIVPLPATTDAGAELLGNAGVKPVDLVYVDANHTFDAVYADICSWWSVVRNGGLFFGDDCTHHYPGVEQAVRRFCTERGLPFEIAGEKWIIPKP